MNEDSICINIQRWRYRSSDNSFIYPYVRPHIHQLSTYIPHYISPNLLTITGLLCSVMNLWICIFLDEYSLFLKHLLASILIVLSFVFDAMDGAQGRKWLENKKDVYVLSQLFDHGCDSLTSILQSFIWIYIFKINLISHNVSILFFMSICLSFLNETLKYKINKCMIFNMVNNPTEIIFLLALFIFIGGVNICNNHLIYYQIPLYLVYFIILVNFIFPTYELLYNLFNKNKTKNISQKLEIISIFILIGSMSILIWHYNLWHITLLIAQYHALNINIIYHEIIVSDCGYFNLFIVIIPQIILFDVILFKQICAITMWLFCVWLWRTYCAQICYALEIKYFWSIPPNNNNKIRFKSN